MIAISEFRDERFSLSRFLPSFLMCKKSVRKMQSTILKSVTFWTKKNKQRDPVINLTPTTVGYLPRTVYAFKRISCWTSGRCSSIKIQLNIPALVAWWFFFSLRLPEIFFLSLSVPISFSLSLSRARPLSFLRPVDIIIQFERRMALTQRGPVRSAKPSFFTLNGWSHSGVRPVVGTKKKIGYHNLQLVLAIAIHI